MSIQSGIDWRRIPLHEITPELMTLAAQEHANKKDPDFHIDSAIAEIHILGAAANLFVRRYPNPADILALAGKYRQHMFDINGANSHHEVLALFALISRMHATVVDLMQEIGTLKKKETN